MFRSINHLTSATIRLITFHHSSSLTECRWLLVPNPFPRNPPWSHCLILLLSKIVFNPWWWLFYFPLLCWSLQRMSSILMRFCSTVFFQFMRMYVVTFHSFDITLCMIYSRRNQYRQIYKQTQNITDCSLHKMKGKVLQPESIGSWHLAKNEYVEVNCNTTGCPITTSTWDWRRSGSPLQLPPV